MSDDTPALPGRPGDDVTPLCSCFAADAEMSEPVEFFVGEIQERIDALRDLWAEARLDEIRSIAHRLKGAGSRYGFPDVTSAAGSLEAVLRSPDTPSDDLQARFEELLLVCRRVAV